MNTMDSRRHQGGVTLVELMISLTIGLFIVGGLMTLLNALKNTSNQQTGLTQLQDSERMALTIMTDVIQQSGFYVSPLVNTLTGSFPSDVKFATAGQYVTGSGAGTAAAPGDSITVRYNTAGGDGIMDCLGRTSTIAAMFESTFSVTGTNLQCAVTTTTAGGTTTTAATTIVTGVQALNILYGVQTNPGSGTNSADTYLDAPGVTAGGYWGSIKSVQVTLAFTNPLAGLSGQTARPTIPLTRVIPVMATL